MSRIGKLPITIPEGVTIEVKKDNTVEIKGSLGILTQKVDPDLEVVIEDGMLRINRPTESKRHRSIHGLYRSLLSNMIEGVSKGYEIKQELVGVGYKATVKGQLLELNLGYSHPIFLQLPPEVNIQAASANDLTLP